MSYGESGVRSLFKSGESALSVKHLSEMPVTQTQFRRKPHALLGLIGSPIGSSASPAMHEAAGEAVGIRCHYQLIDVAGADPAELARLLYGVRRLGFAGVNVTFPYKEAVVGLLDDLVAGRPRHRRGQHHCRQGRPPHRPQHRCDRLSSRR